MLYGGARRGPSTSDQLRSRRAARIVPSLFIVLSMVARSDMRPDSEAVELFILLSRDMVPLVLLLLLLLFVAFPVVLVPLPVMPVLLLVPVPMVPAAPEPVLLPEGEELLVLPVVPLLPVVPVAPVAPVPGPMLEPVHRAARATLRDSAIGPARPDYLAAEFAELRAAAFTWPANVGGSGHDAPGASAE